MYYHFAILLLFRPLIKLRIIGSSISPRDVCSQAADAITGLLRSYAQLYTLRRTPSFVPYFVLTSSIMHLALAAVNSSSHQADSGGSAQVDGSQGSSSKLDPHVVEAIGRGIADLTEMAPCHHFAEQALNILKFMAKKWNIDVDIKTMAGDEPREVEFNDVDKATRPVAGSLNFFAPNFKESDFNCEWGNAGPGVSADNKAGNKLKDELTIADGPENPLFWPFPMQGRPMLPAGKELEEAGFELI